MTYEIFREDETACEVSPLPNPFSSAKEFSAVKNPRERSAAKFSFSGDLRDGHGLHCGGAAPSRAQGHRFG